MSVQDNKAIVRRSYEEIGNNGNLSAINELFAEDFIDHNPAPGQEPGREGYKQAAEVLRAGWADLHVTIDDLIAEGDRVVSRVTSSGRHVGEFLGIPATGKQVTVSSIAIDRVVDGRIAETWTNVDMLSLLQQLGVEVGASPNA